MNTGIPTKKKAFSLVTEDNLGGSCFAEGNRLYVLKYDSSYEQTRPTTIEVYDSDSEAFNEPVLLSNLDKYAMSVKSHDNYIIAFGSQGCIHDKITGNLVFSAYDLLSQEDIDIGANGRLIVLDDFFIHKSNKEIFDSKYNIYHLDSFNFFKEIYLDFEPISTFPNNIIYGKNKNGDIVFFSLETETDICVLDATTYLELANRRGPIKFAHYKDKIVITFDTSVILISTVDWSVIDILNFSNLKEVTSIFDSKHIERNLQITELSFRENLIVVNGNKFYPFLMCLEVVKGKLVFNWINVEGDISLSSYDRGHVIFGKDGNRPVAWDVYSGEMIWQASTLTIANYIRTGSNWVVYGFLMGNFDIYKWRKEYISPNVPVRDDK